MADFFDDNDDITEDISSLSIVLFAQTLNIPFKLSNNFINFKQKYNVYFR
jgi:hypothetical protein